VCLCASGAELLAWAFVNLAAGVADFLVVLLHYLNLQFICACLIQAFPSFFHSILLVQFGIFAAGVGEL